MGANRKVEPTMAERSAFRLKCIAAAPDELRDMWAREVQSGGNHGLALDAKQVAEVRGIRLGSRPIRAVDEGWGG